MTSNERNELEKRILHYIKTTDFSDLSLVNDEERRYIEPERLEDYIQKDTQIKKLKSILIERGVDMEEFEKQFSTDEYKAKLKEKCALENQADSYFIHQVSMYRAEGKSIEEIHRKTGLSIQKINDL